jgi:hypothetical protein
MPRLEVLTEVSEGGPAVPPARSVRRATARRASTRRATARSHQGDTDASIIDFLAKHPGSTSGDLAKGLNLDPGAVSTRLTQLAQAGEIERASHGYKNEERGATAQAQALTPSLNLRARTRPSRRAGSRPEGSGGSNRRRFVF